MVCCSINVVFGRGGGGGVFFLFLLQRGGAKNYNYCLVEDLKGVLR